MSIEAKVRSTLEQVLARDLGGAGDEESLRELGLSSLRMIQLLGELELEFQIRILDDEVDGEHFGTLRQVVRFIESKVQK